MAARLEISFILLLLPHTVYMKMLNILNKSIAWFLKYIDLWAPFYWNIIHFKKTIIILKSSYASYTYCIFIPNAHLTLAVYLLYINRLHSVKVFIIGGLYNYYKILLRSTTQYFLTFEQLLKRFDKSIHSTKDII